MAKSRTKAALNSGAATNNGQLIAQKRGSYFFLFYWLLYLFAKVIYINDTIICSYPWINRIMKGLYLIKSLFHS